MAQTITPTGESFGEGRSERISSWRSDKRQGTRDYAKNKLAQLAKEGGSPF